MKPFPAFSLLILLSLASCTEYDLGIGDSPANRNGFEQSFEFAADANVTQVYYYADEFGADVRYQLSFKCPRVVVDKIISELSLKAVPEDTADSLLAPREDLPWWQPDSVDDRDLWIKEEKNQYYRQLWYSEKDGMAFYLEYSV